MVYTFKWSAEGVVGRRRGEEKGLVDMGGRVRVV